MISKVKCSMLLILCSMALSAQAEDRPDFAAMKAKMEASIESCNKYLADNNYTDSNGNAVVILSAPSPGNRPSQDQMEAIRTCADAGIIQLPKRPGGKRPPGGGFGQGGEGASAAR